MHKVFVAALALLAVESAPLAAQENDDEAYLSVADDPNWYIQKSSCTIANNRGGNGDVTAWLSDNGMGARFEFADRKLRGIKDGSVVRLEMGFDGGATKPTLYDATGYVPDEDRQGYSLIEERELIDRVGAARSLQIVRDGKGVLDLDLAGAPEAIAAMRACMDELTDSAVADVENAADAAAGAAEAAMEAAESTPEPQ